MFQTLITADLPSEEAEAPASDPRRGAHERVTFTPSRLLRALQQVFESAGVHDLAYVVVDGRMVLVDAADSDRRDLSRLLTTVQALGHLESSLDELLLGLVHWGDGIQHVIEARVRTTVPVGEHELMIRVASRPDDLNARRLDDAERYRGRLLVAMGNVDLLDGLRMRVERLVGAIDSSLRRTLFRRAVDTGRTVLQIVRPTRADLLSMEAAPFGPRITPPAWALSPPGTPVEPAWVDPALRVFKDEFVVFRHWVFLDALMNRSLIRLEWVQVVDPDGKLLFEGHKARWFEKWPWGQKFEVELVPEGGVKVRFRD